MLEGSRVMKLTCDVNLNSCAMLLEFLTGLLVICNRNDSRQLNENLKINENLVFYCVCPGSTGIRTM